MQIFDTVAWKYVELPEGWTQPDEKSGDLHGPHGELLQITGPHGRWSVKRTNRRTFRSALAAIKWTEKQRG